MFRKYLSEETLVLHYHFFFHASAKSTSCTKDTREKHVGGQGTPYLPHLHKGYVTLYRVWLLGSCGFQGMQLYTYKSNPGNSNPP